MKRNLYFKGVPDIDFLFMEQILFSYESIPMVFVCTDNGKKRYLCICDDIIDEESWLIVKISNDKLLEILNDVSTVLSVFKGKKVIMANRGFNQGIEYNVMEYNDISEDELPVCDQFLEMRDQLKDYIDKIKSENFPVNVKLYFSSLDDMMDVSEFQSIFVENVGTKLSAALCKNSDNDDMIDHISDRYFSMQIDCNVSCDETNNLGNQSEETFAFAA